AEENSARGELFSHLTVRVSSILLGFAVRDFGLTTPLTIYGFGLRGNSAYKSIRKHRFRTKKPQKVNKSSQKTMLYLSGRRGRKFAFAARRSPSSLGRRRASESRAVFTQDDTGGGVGRAVPGGNVPHRIIAVCALKIFYFIPPMALYGE
ncbi:MAG: hypothetical protein IJX62_09585, partial [Clostridia bacterium]|nr:hypothetical protein [Clostridia bacterium]